ncbi:GNAT family N-acetyltransferase [Rhizobium phaseoli]|uniref:GNAT family N-acetyltransferase n=1 Tax=Rhizobium phaseoli TaxID=396 RepID=UPI0007EA4EF7|nr:GNAT family N-acetyltransferase [Rhizobium phaseoli]
MLRKAVVDDIAALKLVRSSVVENILGDPSKVTDAEYEWFVKNSGVAVWEEQGGIVGFSAADPRQGNIWALFVTPGFEGKGIGSRLLAEACFCLQSAGVERAWLTTDPRTRAERLYRAAGWEQVGDASADPIRVALTSP